MEKISIHELDIGSLIENGSFSEVLRCNFDGKKYAFKKFNNPEEMINKDFIYKTEKLSDFFLKKSVLPKAWVCEDDMYSGYLMEMVDGEDYIFLTDYEKRVSALKNAKVAIMELHSNGIIHTDIHGSNILVLEDGSSMLIDFDNFSYKEIKPLVEKYSDYAYQFVSSFGLSKDLDIYLFNLLTFSSLNKVSLKSSQIFICGGSYGVFDSKESRQICDSLMLDSKVFNNQYLIDTYDPKNKHKILGKKKT